jgi:hypothetical protein
MGFCYVTPSLHVSCVYRKKDSRSYFHSYSSTPRHASVSTTTAAFVPRISVLYCSLCIFCCSHTECRSRVGTLLNPVEEIFGSSHGQETGYPDRGISKFSSGSLSECRDAPQIRLRPHLSICLPVHYSSY